MPLCHPLVVRFPQAHDPFLPSMHQAPGTLISLGMTECFCVSLCPLHLHPTPCLRTASLHMCPSLCSHKDPTHCCPCADMCLDVRGYESRPVCTQGSLWIYTSISEGRSLPGGPSVSKCKYHSCVRTWPWWGISTAPHVRVYCYKLMSISVGAWLIYLCPSCRLWPARLPLRLLSKPILFSCLCSVTPPGDRAGTVGQQGCCLKPPFPGLS